ncbi:uncharacterized protein LOC142521977 [Primulina tabacum]|uniref:uncharacterized protein LOC142521977 n=1 Tax=Primulina tabacum TaxID=48773 RepID=UPI003F59B86E
MKDKLSRMDFELFAINTYAMWRERLNLVHNQGTLGKRFNVNWSDEEAQRLRLLNGKIDKAGNSPKTWTAPQINELRMNVDAAYNVNLNSFAVGGVVRNHEGQPLIAFGMKIRKPASIVYGELAAIDIGMKIANDHNLFINQITSDSLLTVQAVTHIDEDLSYVGTYAQYIRRSLSEHNGATLNHIRRTANAVADSLASFAISHPTSFIWKPGNFPYWFVKLVTKDISQSQ